jgi:glycosyltransferase involved in cell wall biosynthesis
VVALKILLIGNQIRHELGCAASLAWRGGKVHYLHLGRQQLSTIAQNVVIDSGSSKVDVTRIMNPSLGESVFSPSAVLPTMIKESQFDVVITNSLVPFYLARYLARRMNVPLILRIWGIRAAKMLGYNAREIALFFPSTIHNSIQFAFASSLVTLDRHTHDFARRISGPHRPILIYPTYAALYDQTLYDQYSQPENPVQIEKLEENGYVFGIVSLDRIGSNLDRQERPLMKLLFQIAKKSPWVRVVVLGGTETEAKKLFGLRTIPENLKFLGRIYSDVSLQWLYHKARLVVVPLFFKSVSNRLLEALYYGKPILTNHTAKILYPELVHLDHLFMSDSYCQYPEMVRKLLKDDANLESLSKGAIAAYRDFFSAAECGKKMEVVIRSLVRRFDG